jgi:hypothetical protein
MEVTQVSNIVVTCTMEASENSEMESAIRKNLVILERAAITLR